MCGGGTPSTTTQNVTQKTELPAWYVSYLQDVMGRAQTQAGSTQPPPPTQQIAALTPDQQAAYQQVRDIQGVTTPYYDAAGNDISQAGGMSGYKAAAPGLAGAASVDFRGASQAGDANIASGIGLLQSAGARDTASAATPYAQQGAGYLASAAQGSSLAQANPYIAASTNPTGLAAASPYLGAAGQSAAGLVGQYMNPYNSAVTDQIAQLGARNLKENILPGVSDSFIRAGQYGSQQMGTVGERAIRDTQASVLNAQTQALQSGYGQALGAAQNDLSRQAGLAGTAGGLGSAQQQALLGAGQATGQLSSSDLARLQASGVNIGQLGLGLAGAQSTDAARAMAAGQSAGQLGLGQGQLGLNAAQAQSSAMLQAAVAAGQLTEADAARLLQSGLAQQGLGTAAQTAGLQGSAALESVGAAQQGQGQANLNSQFNQQTQQYNLPWDTIAKQSAVIQGLPVGGTTSGTTQTTSPGPNTATQIGGIGLGVAGLANSGIFGHAKGGKVVKYKRSHSYGNTPKRGLAFEEAA